MASLTSDTSSTRLPTGWRVGACAAALGLTGLLLYVGWDGDDFYFLAWTRRLPMDDFLHDLWPPNNLTFRVMLYAVMWAVSWVSAEPVWTIRAIGAATLAPSLLLIYAVTKRLVREPATALAVTFTALIGTDFPWMWTYTTTHWVIVYFLTLWLWLRWWERPSAGRLTTAVAAHAIALLHYEFLLPLAPVCFLLVPVLEGRACLPQLNRRRLVGAAVFVLPLLGYLVFRFGFTGVRHYYSTIAIGGTGGGEAWYAFPAAYAGTIAHEVFVAASAGLPGLLGWIVFATVALCVLVLAWTRRHATDRLVRALAAAAMFCAIVAPFVGIGRNVWSLFPVWALLVCILQLQPPARGAASRWLVVAVVVFSLSAAVRIPKFVQRGQMQRSFAAALRDAASETDGPVRFWIRNPPEMAGFRPLMTSMSTFGMAWLPWPQSRGSKVYAWPQPGAVPLAMNFWQTRRAPTSLERPLERVLRWTGERLEVEPVVLAPAATSPYFWNRTTSPGLSDWRAFGQSELTASDQAITWAIAGGRHLLASPALPAETGRFNRCRLLAKLAVPGRAHAQVQLVGFAPGAPMDIALATASVRFPMRADGEWHEYWVPLGLDPRFAVGQPVSRIGFALVDGTIPSALMAIADVSLIP